MLDEATFQRIESICGQSTISVIIDHLAISMIFIFGITLGYLGKSFQDIYIDHIKDREMRQSATRIIESIIPSFMQAIIQSLAGQGSSEIPFDFHMETYTGEIGTSDNPNPIPMNTASVRQPDFVFGTNPDGESVIIQNQDPTSDFVSGTNINGESVIMRNPDRTANDEPVTTQDSDQE